MHDPGKRRIILAVVGLALLVGIALRTWHLGGPSLWLDEGYTYVIARSPIDQIPAVTARYERAPPLYYVTVHAFLSFSESEAALRGASVLSGILAILAAVWLGTIAFGRAEGALAGLLLSVSALHVMMSHDARNYAMAAFFVTLSTGFWLKELRDPGRTGNLALYVLSATLAVYTHYVCLACVGLQWVCGVLPFNRRTALPRLCAAAGVALLFLPWLPTMLAHGERKTTGLAGWDAFPDALFVQLAGFFLHLWWNGVSSWLDPIWVWRALAASAFVLMGASLLRRDVPSTLFFVVCAGTMASLILISITFRMGIYNAKYLVLVAPLFWLLVARTATLAWTRGMRVATGLAVAGLLAVNVVSTTNLLLVDEWNNQDWRAAVDLLARDAQDGDLVLLEPAQALPVVEYYWTRRQPSAVLLGVDRARAAALAPEALRHARRVWLLQGEPGMVDSADRVASMLAASRPRLRHWRAHRYNPSLTVTATLFGPPR